MGNVDYHLSRAEIAVMQELANGFLQREIAEKLFVSTKTIKNHLNRIYKKLGASDRYEAARIYRASLESI